MLGIYCVEIHLYRKGIRNDRVKGPVRETWRRGKQTQRCYCKTMEKTWCCRAAMGDHIIQTRRTLQAENTKLGCCNQRVCFPFVSVFDDALVLQLKRSL